MDEERCDQFVIPEATPGVSQYEFKDWHTAQAAQRALLEIYRSVAAAKVLFMQMHWKEREIGRSKKDVASGISYAAREFGAMAREMERMPAEE